MLTTIILLGIAFIVFEVLEDIVHDNVSDEYFAYKFIKFVILLSFILFLTQMCYNHGVNNAMNSPDNYQKEIHSDTWRLK